MEKILIMIFTLFSFYGCEFVEAFSLLKNDGNNTKLNSECRLNFLMAKCPFEIDLTAFMNTEFDFVDPVTNKEYSLSSNIQSIRNTSQTASFVSIGSQIDSKDCTNTWGQGVSCTENVAQSIVIPTDGVVLDSIFKKGTGLDNLSQYAQSVKEAHFKSPNYPNVIFHSRVHTPNYLPEIFRYDSSKLNALYVFSDPEWGLPNKWMSFWQTPGDSIAFADRGYFWNSTKFILTSISEKIWRSPLIFQGFEGWMKFNLSGSRIMTSDGYGKWVAMDSSLVQVSYADYYETNGNDWYNYLPVGPQITGLTYV